MSIWTQDVTLPRFQPLNRDLKVDVLIIGGGMAGILCAHMLAKTGIRYALVEADRIGSGTTKNTTAKLTFSHRLLYQKLIKKYGKENAKRYLEANKMALEEYRRLCGEIDCDYVKKDSYVYSLNDRRILEKEVEALQTLGCEAELKEEISLPFPVCGAVRVKDQAEFHPLKFLSAIVPNLNIYENTCVKELAPHAAVTQKGRITADKIIVATHFPMNNKHGSYFLKLYQNRSYVIALKNAGDVNGMYIDEKETGMSFRNYKDVLLIGGGSHRTGKKGGNWNELDQFAKQYYPGAKKVGQWAAQDCITLDEVPYIGPYSKNTTGLFVATGFNKWGMTGAMAAAQILTDMVMEVKNEYASVFSPSRTMIHPGLFVNAWEAMAGLLTISKKRCPHMGCALKWNKQEHSWDCPCHGSRFTKEGKLIDNPATGDLK